MTSLPVCNYWIFSNMGLLIEDWLLEPPRPLDLTNRWRQTALEPSVTSRVFEPIQNKTLQILVYFALPLLPVLSILIAMVNIINEAKNYMCPRKVLACRPYVTRLSHTLMVFFVLASITSILTWTGCLMRYIPMSPYTHQTFLEQHSTDTRSLTNETKLLAISTHPAQETKFISQLPAILTMQAVLRLTLIWVTLGLITDRICILNRLIQNPTGARLRLYVQTIHQLCALDCQTELCPMQHLFSELHQAGRRGSNYSSNGINNTSTLRSSCCEEVNNMLRRCCRHSSYVGCFGSECCHESKQTLHEWSQPTGYASWHKKGQKCECNSIDNYCCCCCCSTRMKMPSETTCSVGQTFLTTAFLICLALGVCLPQLWAYQLTKADQNVGPQKDNLPSQRKWIRWQLSNRTGRALYEYGLAIVSFVVPSCLLLASVMLLVTKVWMTGRRLTHRLAPKQLGEDKYSVTRHDCLVRYCVTCLNRDSMLALVLGLNYIFCWLPHTTITTVHRLNCLLSTDHNGSNHVLDRNAWPKQVGWLWIELIVLIGDFSAQLSLLLIRLCEPVCKILERKDQVTSSLSDGNEEVEVADYHMEMRQNNSEEEDEEPALTKHHNMVGSPPRPSHVPKSWATQVYKGKAETFVPVHASSDDGQTSQNISPLPTSHTLSEAVQLPIQPRFGRRYPILNSLEARSCHSNPSPYPSPLTTRIPSHLTHLEPASLQLNPTQLSYNEPRSSTVLLTYSPRSRHPCRTRREPARHQHHPTPSSPNSNCAYWAPHPSPPPLPPPPRHLAGMIGDSSIYSTPHGSPKDQNSRSASHHTSSYSQDTPRLQFQRLDAPDSDNAGQSAESKIPQDVELSQDGRYDQSAQRSHKTLNGPYSSVFS